MITTRNKIINSTLKVLAFVGITSSVVFSACKKDYEQPSQFSSFEIDITPGISGHKLDAGTEVHFTDISQGVKSRIWTFEPEENIAVRAKVDSTSDNIIHVTCHKAGDYKIRLQTEFMQQIPTVVNEDGTFAPGFVSASVLDTVFTISIAGELSSDFELDGLTWNDEQMTITTNEVFTCKPGEELLKMAEEEELTYEWTIEDGEPSTATSQTVETYFSTPGEKTVTLTVTRAVPQASSTTTKTVIVAPAPLDMIKIQERDDQVIQVVYSQALKDFSDVAGDFQVVGTNNDTDLALSIKSVTRDTDEPFKINVALNEPIYADDEIKLTYTPGANVIVSEDGNQPISAFENQLVEMDNMGNIVPDVYNTDWLSVWEQKSGVQSMDVSTTVDYDDNGGLHVTGTTASNALFRVSSSSPAFTLKQGRKYKVSYQLKYTAAPKIITNYVIQRPEDGVIDSKGTTPSYKFRTDDYDVDVWNTISFIIPDDVTISNSGLTGDVETGVYAFFIQIGKSDFDVVFDNFIVEEIDKRP